MRTITADNGSEFISWDFLEYVQKELKIKLYYATPSSPQQRGSNENRNRKLRDWYPKGTSFKDVKQRQLDEVASKMNAMPLRQALDGKRPMVVFEQEYKAMQRYRRAYEKRKQRMLEVKKQEFEFLFFNFKHTLFTLFISSTVTLHGFIFLLKDYHRSFTVKCLSQWHSIHF